jgi:hypothetical protein
MSMQSLRVIAIAFCYAFRLDIAVEQGVSCSTAKRGNLHRKLAVLQRR